MGALFAVSLQPCRPQADAVLSQFDRPFHLAAFDLISILLSRFFDFAGVAVLPASLPLGSTWIHALLATTALGGIIEVLQHLIYAIAWGWGDFATTRCRQSRRSF